MPPNRRVLVGFTAPFAAFIGVMALEHALALPVQVMYPIRILVVTLTLLAFSRPYVTLRPTHAISSILMGAAVFVIWVAPDLLFNYRHSWPFDNSLMGHPVSTVPPQLRHSVSFCLMRVAGATLLVPILEELFWSGWLMRWLIHAKFQEVPFGAYLPGPFWIVAALFASEHGSYWEVGLLAGIAYNWWAVRTRSLADCILAHSVTNGILSAYVLLWDKWEYWS